MKLQRFPGSVYFTDEILPKDRTYTPRAIDVPLFMNKRVRVRTNYGQYRQYIEKNQKLYTCPELPEEDFELLESLPESEIEKCPKYLSKLGRTNFERPAWQQAPNRYNIKHDCCPRPGTKGAIFSTLARTPQTLPGRLAPPKMYGHNVFYDIPCGTNWNNFCNKAKGKFLSDARSRRPSLRFMISDLALCWKDPIQPCAANYYPMNHTIEHKLLCRKKPQKLIIYKYLPNSVVPDPRLKIHELSETSAMTPGPGRYNPLETACPCHCKRAFDPFIWAEIERNRRNRYRRLPHFKIKSELYCPNPHLRNIRGHGFTWIFKSKLSRISQTSKKSSPTRIKTEKKLQHSAKYIQMIANPTRSEISTRTGSDTIKRKPKQIKFNSICKPGMRKSMRSNKKVAFLSSCPRFSGDETLAATAAKRLKQKEQQKLPRKPSSVKQTNKHLVTNSKGNIVFTYPPEYDSLENIGEASSRRLSKFSKQKAIKPVSGREKMFSFSPLPQPKLLLKDYDLGRYDSTELNLYFRDTDPEDYFKDEYKENFAIKILKDSLGHRPLNLLIQRGLY